MINLFMIDARGIAEAGTVAAAFGVAWARHWPVPYEDQVWYGSFFDAVQDRLSNNDRIGIRRKRTENMEPKGQ